MPFDIFYSTLKLSTGFVMAAFMDWKLTVTMAISKARTAETKNGSKPIVILYAKS